MDPWVAAFATLPIPSAEGDGFSVAPIADHGGIAVARDRDGRPAFLVSLPESASTVPSATVGLKYVSVSGSQVCRIFHNDGSVSTGTFAVVRCLADSVWLRDYFLKAVGAVVGQLADFPTAQQVSSALSRLAELFHGLTLGGKRTVQGLWTELFVVASATDPGTLIQAWHSDPMDIFDFSIGGHRLEAKSVSRAPRQHHFSFEQLDPLPGTSVLVASTTTARSGGGPGVAALVEEILGRLGKQEVLIDKLYHTVGLSLGADWPSAADAGFDRELAQRDLNFYRAEQVPRIASIPVGVSNVQFVSDLTACRRVSRKEMIAMGGLLAAAIPLK